MARSEQIWKLLHRQRAWEDQVKNNWLEKNHPQILKQLNAHLQEKLAQKQRQGFQQITRELTVNALE